MQCISNTSKLDVCVGAKGIQYWEEGKKCTLYNNLISRSHVLDTENVESVALCWTPTIYAAEDEAHRFTCSFYNKLYVS